MVIVYSFTYPLTIGGFPPEQNPQQVLDDIDEHLLQLKLHKLLPT